VIDFFVLLNACHYKSLKKEGGAGGGPPSDAWAD